MAKLTMIVTVAKDAATRSMIGKACKRCAVTISDGTRVAYSSEGLLHAGCLRGKERVS